MAGGQWSVVLRHVHRIFHGGGVAGLTEGQLLDRFIARRDEVAFGAIVARHGPMVLGVCRQFLDDSHEVEDAFQATFLVLVRKASALRDRDRLAPWLHGVARRVARRARAGSIRRRDRERPEVEAEARAVGDLDAEGRELSALIRAEVDRLPPAERTAVALCYLGGMTHQEAAEHLGWPVGTVKGRLARARDRLRGRLSRRGVAGPAGALAVALDRTGPVAVPADLIASTTLAAGRAAAGGMMTAGIVSARAVTLAEGVVRTMLFTKLKLGAAAIAATCAIAIPGALAYQGIGPADGPPASKSRAKNAAPSVNPPVPGQPAAPVMVATAGVDLAHNRAERMRVAELALKSLDRRVVAGELPDSSGSLRTWSRRLAEAKSGPETPQADRLAAIKAHCDRMGLNLDRAISLAKIGQGTQLDCLEAEYQLIEALQGLLEAQAGPAIPGAGGGGIGGGFGEGGGAGASPGREPLVIKTMPGDEERKKAILAKLEERIAMPFRNETPLEDIKKYIEQSTQDEKAGLPNGIPIYIDPQGLQDADKTMASTIALNLEGIPLRTTLRLLLRQLGMGYKVQGGLLFISDEASVKE